jgi:hypothetical protein
MLGLADIERWIDDGRSVPAVEACQVAEGLSEARPFDVSRPA